MRWIGEVPVRSEKELRDTSESATLSIGEPMGRFERVTINPEVMSGKPCIRGMRVTVGMIVESLSAGRSEQSLLADFPYLEEQDIREALGFAAQLAQGHDVRLLRTRRQNGLGAAANP